MLYPTVEAYVTVLCLIKGVTGIPALMHRHTHLQGIATAIYSGQATTAGTKPKSVSKSSPTQNYIFKGDPEPPSTEKVY